MDRDLARMLGSRNAADFRATEFEDKLGVTETHLEFERQHIEAVKRVCLNEVDENGKVEVSRVLAALRGNLAYA